MTIYQDLLGLGVELDHHESDLYFPVTAATHELVRRYEFRGNVRTFANQVSGTLWYEAPFAYAPWWEARQAKVCR